MPLKFIDLFAGLGGFHVGLKSLGMKCVFASELNPALAKLYSLNHHLPEVAGDIRKVREQDIPAHDLLCAGFPCQPFSKAGAQEGMRDEVRGNLFNDIVRILKHHQPRYLLLENVANLEKHDKGQTWVTIHEKLDELGYEVQKRVLSPHQFNVPQLRQRVFIVGELRSEGGLKHFAWPKPEPFTNTIHTILEPPPAERRAITNGEEKALGIWQEFLDAIPADSPLPSFPIWATEYKATYPFERTVPSLCKRRELAQLTGAFGCSLLGFDKEAQLARIPTYAHGDALFPPWKQDFIRQNRAFFTRYERELAPIIEKLKALPFSWQKFEWNCKDEPRDLRRLIIQFRPSGIRLKRANYAPALVSFTRTQVPALGWEWGYLTPKEAARLQSLGDIKLPTTETVAFRALGNAVNAEVIHRIATSLVSCPLPALSTTAPNPHPKYQQASLELA